MKTRTSATRDSINHGSCQLALLFIALSLGCFPLAPEARAVCREGCDLTQFNTFLGADALTSNTTGTENTATGAGALTANTTGIDNTATGSAALASNTTGEGNTATGEAALFLNTTGTSNTAVGQEAMVNNTTGGDNTAVGVAALFRSTGNNNTAVGFLAGQNLGGNNNIALGYLAGQYLGGDNNIAIGNQGGVADSGVIKIGTTGTHTATFVAGIRETPIAALLQVGINVNGQLGVRGSSARFKKDVKPMDKASETILALKPVIFRYTEELDPAGIRQFGLVAEEVEKVDSDLVVRDDKGKPYTVRYEAVNAMLLNEFLKDHKKVEEQQATIAQLRSTVAQQQKSLEAKIATQEAQIGVLTAALQKVSAQLELSKAAPRTVLNNR
jgi:hypothetical protein